MNDTYFSYKEENGTINISEDVIVSLIKETISEISGVAGLQNAAGTEIAELIGIKYSARGIKVRFEDQHVITDVIINVLFGYKIMVVAKEVQEKLISAIESVTGFSGTVVNVHVAGISFD